MDIIIEILGEIFGGIIEIFMCAVFNNKRTYIPRICSILCLVFVGLLVDIPILIWGYSRYQNGGSAVLPVFLFFIISSLIVVRMISICRNAKKYEILILEDGTELIIEKFFAKRQTVLEIPDIKNYAPDKSIMIRIDCSDEMENFSSSYNKKFFEAEKQELQAIRKLTDCDITYILEQGIKFDNSKKRKINNENLVKDVKLTAIEVLYLCDTKYKIRKYGFQTGTGKRLDITIRADCVTNIQIR